MMQTIVGFSPVLNELNKYKLILNVKMHLFDVIKI